MDTSQVNMTPVGLTSPVTYSIGYNDVIMGTTKRTHDVNQSPSTALVIQGVLYGILLVLGMLFNCCVVWLIRQKRTLHTVTNMWVTSLCISQVLLSATSLPIIVLSVIADDWLLGSVFCRIFGFYTTCFRTVSILSVAGIAIDRYHVVTRPFSARIRKSSARFLILLTWWCGVVASSPPLVGVGLYRYSANSHVCGISWSLGGSSLILTVFYITAVYIMSFLASSFSYNFIYQVTKKQVKKRRKPSFAGGLATSVSSSNIRNRNSGGYTNESVIEDENFGMNNDIIINKKEDSHPRKRLTTTLTAKMNKGHMRLKNRISSTISGTYLHNDIDSRAMQSIALVLSVFFLTWVPYFSFALYMASVGGSGLPYPLTNQQAVSSTLYWMEFVTTWLSFSNVVWDPLLYGAFNHNFRTHLK